LVPNAKEFGEDLGVCFFSERLFDERFFEERFFAPPNKFEIKFSIIFIIYTNIFFFYN